MAVAGNKSVRLGAACIYRGVMTSTASSSALSNLGNSDLMLTPIGFGAWAIGGGNWEFAWGPQDDSDSIAAIHRALELGVNWIDTAAIYGLGHSEEIVARALEAGPAAPLCLHQVLDALAPRSHHLALAEGQVPSRRTCNLPPPSRGRRHRPLSDSLAQSRRGDRGRMGSPGPLQGGRQGALDWRIELQRGSDEARAQKLRP